MSEQDENLFATGNESTEQANEDNTTSPLDQLVGEKRKFKSVDDLAKGKLEADAFIENLKGQLKEKDEQYADLNQRLLEMQERVNKAEELMQKSVTGNNAGQEPNPAGVQQPHTPEDLKSLIASTLTEREQEAKMQTNVAEAKRVLTERYGSLEAGREVLKGVMEKTGWDETEVTSQIQRYGIKVIDPYLGNATKKVSGTSSPTTNVQAGTSTYNQTKITTSAEAHTEAVRQVKEKYGRYDPSNIMYVQEKDKLKKQIMQENGL